MAKRDKDGTTNAEPMTYTRSRLPPRDTIGEPEEVTKEVPEAPAPAGSTTTGGRGKRS